jgi:hypothetical protein
VSLRPGADTIEQRRLLLFAVLFIAALLVFAIFVLLFFSFLFLFSVLLLLASSSFSPLPDSSCSCFRRSSSISARKRVCSS